LRPPENPAVRESSGQEGGVEEKIKRTPVRRRTKKAAIVTKIHEFLGGRDNQGDKTKRRPATAQHPAGLADKKIT